MPKWNDPKFLEKLAEKVRSSSDFLEKSGKRMPDLNHWRNIHDAVRTAARNGIKGAMEVAEPLLRKGVDFGGQVGEMVILGANSVSEVFGLLIINPAAYDKRWQSTGLEPYIVTKPYGLPGGCDIVQ